MNLIQSKGKWTSREGQGDTGTGERCNERISSTVSWKKEAYEDYVPNTLDTHRNSHYCSKWLTETSRQELSGRD
ncbi:hypothetical protein CHARACLAT_007107 [Characodon lateralis]|uniref:Uncharacterized protein n=1 Tax=Characodon lateralis TaxID=208331 RepID=A0ABU7CL49_9TELE|nr:hypothetical protein [Characodon lateralis]